uniref:G1/S-specific cyclin-D1-like n=1 Tax=Myxine glutinosa TaxID=7769 RepID=UPI00358E3AF1
MARLLLTERHYQPPLGSMELASDLQLRIRNKLIDFIVYEAELCKNDVLILTFNYLDRCIFSMTLSDDDELYALGGACLFLAYKMQTSNPVSASRLFMCTSKFDRQQLLDMERKVLISLEWKVVAVTAIDFMQQILYHLVFSSADLSRVHNQAETCAMISVTDLKFAKRSSSLIAAASVYAAIMQMGWLRETWPGFTNALDKICTIIKITPECVRACQEEIEEFIQTILQPSQSHASPM